ncbi:hypothetical protein [Sulfurimonas sp.]|jgi:septum formation inhibitor MinC|uniref:hypothetical protein n=1 Tax=Sulfurimonas sp. TaxID=2022749 RepID=UPI0025CE58D3|nr:hypothetical protein [Sulfurimonas sp.]MCK9472847.1 hypothetical protein [Sulfurimonas sp.]MDD3505186.1 hypothetical protein [Sulfurimonas sp.]
MNINKVFKGIEKLFFSKIDDKQKKEELQEKLHEKIQQTKKEIKNAQSSEDVENLRAKLYILKKLLDRV